MNSTHSPSLATISMPTGSLRLVAGLLRFSRLSTLGDRVLFGQFWRWERCVCVCMPWWGPNSSNVGLEAACRHRNNVDLALIPGIRRASLLEGPPPPSSQTRVDFYGLPSHQAPTLTPNHRFSLHKVRRPAAVRTTSYLLPPQCRVRSMVRSSKTSPGCLFPHWSSVVLPTRAPFKSLRLRKPWPK